MNSLRLVLAFAVLVLAPDTAFPYPSDVAVGSKAPALSVDEIIKGKPVEGLQEGTAYVVEFWATWCPPCVASIPHLTKLQKKHKNIVVLGVAGSERSGKEPLEAFVKKQGSKMAYTVAYDSDRSMSAAWMSPAGQNGIPCAFIVDTKGMISWIGNPHDKAFDAEVAKVAKGSKLPKSAKGGSKEDGEDATKPDSQPDEQPKPTVSGTPATPVTAAVHLGSWGLINGLYGASITKAPEGELALGSLSPVVYIPRNAGDVSANKASFGVFFHIGFRQGSGDFESPTAGFLPVGGAAQSVSIQSSDDQIVKVYEDGSAAFVGPGRAIVSVKAGNLTVGTEIEVVQLPFTTARNPQSATTAGAVVQALGFPDVKNRIFVSWPDRYLGAGISYRPNAGSSVSVEHWEFKKYPRAVIAVTGNPTTGWVSIIGTKTGQLPSP